MPDVPRRRALVAGVEVTSSIVADRDGPATLMAVVGHLATLLPLPRERQASAQGRPERVKPERLSPASWQAETVPLEPTFLHRQVKVSDSSLHVVEAGDPEAAPFLFLHGWPETWYSWRHIMAAASGQVRAIAIDLPGIGESTGDPTDGSKRQMAAVVHSLIETMGLKDLTLVGQDVGGMITYAYLRMFPNIRRSVIMDVVIPGIDPWEQVLTNPYLWHFAFHSIPRLPETLVQGHQGQYFAYFYDAISADPSKITTEARAVYAQAYATDNALTAGFNWYRTFTHDAAANNEADNKAPTETRVLYLRGEHEGGRIDDYLDGLRSAGLTHLDQALVPNAGHFTQEEAPEDTWRLIAEFSAG
jgi:pimeloyl-ACP methyl ester carboxylesterase